MSAPAPLSPTERDGVLTLAQVRVLMEPARPPAAPLPGRTQVVVVGAGPAGLTAANLLGSLGVDTLLLEAKADTADQPKAIAIDDEYLRLLTNLGFGPALAPHRSAPFGIWFMGADHRPIVKVAGATTANGFGRRSAILQPMFEKILLTGALDRPSVRVRFDTRVEAVIQNGNGAEVRTAAGVVRCDYVLACDGVRSPIRSALGIAFVGTHIDEPHLVVDLADFPDRSPFSRFFCDPRRPFNSVPSVYGGRRIEFMLKPDDDHDYLVTDEGVRALVEEHTPYRGAPLNIVRRTVYGFAEKIAARLKDGRVFLLGDAAHVMPPFGGQGMNTAARDAHNLCWKLAEVLSGAAPERLLDSYDPERRPQIMGIVKYSVLVGRFANIRSRRLAWLRDLFFRVSQRIPAVRRYFEEMRYMPRARMSVGVIAPTEPRHAPLVGVTFPRWAMRVEGEEMSVDELAGDGFCLLGVGVSAAAVRDAARHPVWSQRAPSLIAIAAPGTGAPSVRCAQVEGASPELDQLRGTICVIRPDRYVAAVVAPERAAAVFDALAGLLGSGAERATAGHAEL